MVLTDFLIPGPSITKVMTLENSRIFEQFDGPIDRGDGNMRIDRKGTAIQFFRVRMIIGFGDNARDHPPLFSHAQALLHAGFSIRLSSFRPVHVT